MKNMKRVVKIMVSFVLCILVFPVCAYLLSFKLGLSPFISNYIAPIICFLLGCYFFYTDIWRKDESGKRKMV